MAHPHTLRRWGTDTIDTWERETPTVDDDPHARIALLGPVVPAEGVVEVIPTWAAATPPYTWVEVQLIVAGEGGAQRFRVAAWDSAGSDSHRSSFARQAGLRGHLVTDTVVLSGPAATLQARVLLCAEPGADMPELNALMLASSSAAEAAPPQPSALSPQPSALQLPLLLSQYSYDPQSPWCSPTSLAMALAYWHERTGDPRLAPFRDPACVTATLVPQIYDPAWEGTGNWAFNTAYAASLGLTAYVTRLHSLEQVARWTAAGVPVIVSVAWEEGEIAGATGRTAGHITVVRGFDGERALMAEPAARLPAPVERAYSAADLARCWQRTSRGTVYLVYPPGWATPAPGPGDAWA